MQFELLEYLRCPISRQPLTLTVIDFAEKVYGNKKTRIIKNGVLTCDNFCYPVIDGVPRLLVESIIDYSDFLEKYLFDFAERKRKILDQYCGLIDYAVKKNNQTKKSFSVEWNQFDYNKDATWNARQGEMVKRFLKEVDESEVGINGKVVFDAGCGNGLLDNLMAGTGVKLLALDLSLSVERAFENNENPNAYFIQGDIQFPPIAFNSIDILHCSGVAHHSNNTELTFSALLPTIKPGGKASFWLYHHQKDIFHVFLLFIRRVIKPFPYFLKYYFCYLVLFPPIFIIKKIKGNKQNRRELMIDLLDGLTPQFRWEHDSAEVTAWFRKFNFDGIKITTDEKFGFNIVGNKYQN